MLLLKPFIKITILSIFLAFILIYLGIKYHWGDRLKSNSNAQVELHIPEKNNVAVDNEVINNNENNFVPEIIKSNSLSPVLESMNKAQITEHCVSFLSKEIKDPLTLELAIVNCVVSNFQETFQSSTIENATALLELENKTLQLKQQCTREYSQITSLSTIEKQLMIGMCVSDKLNTN